MAVLKTLDFSKFLDGTELERAELSKDLVESFKHHGFAKLTNHGVKDEQVAELFKWSSKLFHLPYEEKVAIANLPRDAPQRGWSRQGDETTAYLRQDINDSNRDLSDEKEHFDCGAPDDSEYPNQWPSEAVLSGFRPFMEKSYGDFLHTCLQIFEAMEIGLALPPGTLVDRCQRTASEFRLNHYPAVPLSKLREGKSKRGWPHADFGLITLVFQDSVGGLEMEDRSNPGTFVPVQPGSKTEVAVNISESFQRWSNDVVKAGIHQVAPPVEMLGLEDAIVPERYSNVFFLKADREAMMGPLPEFVTEENPAKYDNLTALEFQKHRTKWLHSIRYS